MRSKLRLLLVAEAGVRFLWGEEDEEGVTGYWGRNERLRTDEFAIVSVMDDLELLVNCPIFESWRSYDRMPITRTRAPIRSSIVKTFGIFQGSLK